MQEENIKRLFNKFVSFFYSTPYIHGPKDRLVHGENCMFANTIFNTRSGNIVLHNKVVFGHNCMVLTGRHFYQSDLLQVDESDNYNIIIEDECWITSGSVIVAPCHLQKGTIIAANSVITNVTTPPFSIWGSPLAKQIKQYDKN